ncbi:MAG: tetratricopeptide repeat protein [Treponema sp.]|nr:tetratricopeptide repeat protein [Treponema sp.]
MSTVNLLSKKQIRENYEAYTEYFSEIMQNVVTILQQNIKLSAQPTYKSRVKSFESYYKKVLRLKPEKVEDENTLIYLTDMMGIRMICAFLEDINFGLEQIKGLFEIREVEVKGAEKKFSEFGYESIHVLIKIPENCKPELSGKYEGLKPISDEIVCEIQIRTILQDAWAEVEHELIYKTEFNPFDIPLRRKLASINASLTLADITFQEIRDYQNKLQKALDVRRRSFYSIADNLLNDEHDSKGNNEDISRVTPFVQGTIDDLILRAIQAHNEGHLQEAVDIYTRIIEAVPDSDKNVLAVIRKHRGMAYFAMNHLDEALDDFQKSIDADPKAYRSYYYKGIVYSIQKKYEEAIECYTQSLEINQFQAHANFRRALAYFELQEYEKSMNDLNIAVKLGLKPEECASLQEKLVKKFDMNM